MRALKLVRDKIPQLYRDTVIRYDVIPGTRAMRIELLKSKWFEEGVEYILKPSAEELADALEVLRGLAHHELRVDWDVIEDIRWKKYRERGGFDRGTIMYAAEADI